MANPVAAPVNLLEHVGASIWDFLKKEAPVANEIVKEVDQVAVFAEPFVAIGAPEVSPLFNLVANAVFQAEAAGSAALAGAPAGSNDEQKAALVFAGVAPIFAAFYQAKWGVTPTEQQILAFIKLIVQLLKVLPAPAPTFALPAKAA